MRIQNCASGVQLALGKCSVALAADNYMVYGAYLLHKSNAGIRSHATCTHIHVVFNRRSRGSVLNANLLEHANAV